jgi:ABC-type uncharacterized transport system involved in gliding motility auxiliary subunit
MRLGHNLAERAGQIAGKRQVRFGANATVMTIALIGILVLANILAVRNHKRWDLTADQTFSLSPQTVQIIESLKRPVQITGFFGKSNRAQQDDLESRLKEYTSRSNQISYRFIDPDTDPVAARNYNITSYGTLVFESEGRRQQITGTDEQDLTGTLLKVLRDRPATVYFLTGHGERSIDNSDTTGYSSARQALEQDNLRVNTLTLAISNTIPLSDTVLVVADPQQPIPPREEQAIRQYVAGGGRLMVLGNPLAPPPLAGVVQAAGLNWNDDLVIDERSALDNPVAPVVVQYPYSDITKNLNGQAAVFPTARTLQQVEPPLASVTLMPLLQSSDNSQAATDFKSGQVQLSPNDKRGPLTFGYSAEGPISTTAALTDTVASGPKARIVVIGDADFADNTYLNQPGAQGNDTFFRSAVAWLAAQDELIALPPKPTTDRSMFLDAGQTRFVFYSSTFGLPLLVLIAGVAIWWRRR